MARRFCVLTLTGLIGSDSLSRLANSAFADHSDETLHPIFLHDPSTICLASGHHGTVPTIQHRHRPPLLRLT
ncbi:hypothetical protein F5882DRAFT_26408 [Hyaloscypha sp. PMI_1271]|nr:hypothetical protein F5882DRAFT_26408 [Hyaloscypha sp. PMI_1271]